MNSIKNILRILTVFALTIAFSVTAYAGTLNPDTGDTTGRYIWIVAAVAGVALVVAIISGIASKKNGKKK